MGSPDVVPISPHVRAELKQPLGRLILDEEINKETISEFFSHKTSITVCVGDRTTERVHGFGLSPSLEIVDFLERRMPRKFLGQLEPSRTVLKAINPSGSISREAMHKLDESLQLLSLSPDAKIRIEVEGEEDLLTLPVIAFFPEPTFIFYGQPGEGMVVVESKNGRERSRAILAEMGIFSLV